jgi:chromosome segregation protein
MTGAVSPLLQAIREIDGTAPCSGTFRPSSQASCRSFKPSWRKCELRLAVPDDPLEVNRNPTAPAKDPRIHLLSSGERTLVATSLLFAILTKPGRSVSWTKWTRRSTVQCRLVAFSTGFRQAQFLVITHNPRTMQAADAVYGVTMQEPGVSTIVGVRLGEQATRSPE